MKAYRTIRTAMKALRRNPMRALLTTLGIVIGVAAVIAMMEIGSGSSRAIQQTIASMGANTLLVMPGTAASGGVSFGAGSVMTMTPEDCAAILRECPAVFIIGIGWTLKDGYPHEMRAADYDDWCTETISIDGHPCHGLNGDILVWNHVTQRRHELSSMGIRVNAETLQKQLALTRQLDFLRYPYHQAIVRDEIPLSIGGGIGQSRTMMMLLRKAHLGEVTVSVWPKILKEICARKNIHVLE